MNYFRKQLISLWYIITFDVVRNGASMFFKRLLVVLCLTHGNRHQRCSICIKSCFLKFRNIHRKTPVLESFLNKVAGLEAYPFRLATLLKRDSNTGIFLWILKSFLEQLFWKTSANRCFWKYNGVFRACYIECF